MIVPENLSRQCGIKNTFSCELKPYRSTLNGNCSNSTGSNCIDEKPFEIKKKHSDPIKSTKATNEHSCSQKMNDRSYGWPCLNTPPRCRFRRPSPKSFVKTPREQMNNYHDARSAPSDATKEVFQHMADAGPLPVHVVADIPAPVPAIQRPPTAFHVLLTLVYCLINAKRCPRTILPPKLLPRGSVSQRT